MFSTRHPARKTASLFCVSTVGKRVGEGGASENFLRCSCVILSVEARKMCFFLADEKRPNYQAVKRAKLQRIIRFIPRGTAKQKHAISAL